MQSEAKTSEGQDFSKYWFIFKRRWLPAGAVAAGLFTVLMVNVLSKPNIYQAKGLLRFNIEPDSTAKVLGSDALTSLSPFGVNNERFLSTEIRFMFSREFLESVVRSLPRSDEKMPSVAEIQAGLKVIPVEKTDVVEVSYDSLKPTAASEVVNQILQAYVRSNLQSNRTKARATREFIVEQVPKVRQRVYVADSALRKFKETYGIVDLTESKAAAVKVQATVQEQLGTIDGQLADVNAQLGSLRQKLGVTSQQALAVSAVGQSPGVKDSLKAVEETQRQLTEAKANLAANHPAVVDLQERYQDLQALLKQRIAAELNDKTASIQGPVAVGETRQALLDTLIKTELARTGLQQQRQELTSQQQSFNSQAKFIPGLEQRARELERELGAAEKTYESLLKSLQEVQITENQTVPTVKIIESAIVPLAPIGPNRLAEAVRSAIASLLVAAAVAYLLETTDRKLKTVDSIRESYAYPLLGNIPLFEELEHEYRRIPVLADPKSTISESYRMLQANLKFLRSDSPVRVITITSAQPGEGKSVTASNLSAVLSQLGHRVLLIDADLRRPTTHQIWEISNRTGLSNLLTDTEDESFSALPVHVVSERLQILTAGPIPPNPLALIDSQRMADFIKAQSENYDYILIDTPPLTVAADPLVISRFSDGILLIARPEVLEKGSIKIAQNKLQQSGVSVLGVVANGVVLKNESYSYYHYSKNYYAENNVVERKKSDKLRWKKPEISVRQ